MRREIAPAAALACCFLCGVARAEAPTAVRSTSWLQRRLESGLADAVGGSVRIGRIDVDWTTLAATIGDVSITIPAEGAAPLTATLAEGKVKLAWSGLGGLAAGDVHMTEVVARGATFSLSREWIEAWKPSGSKKSGAVALQIDRLVVEDATAEYRDGHNRVRVATQAMDFRGDWSTSRRLLVGEVHCTATVEAPIFDRPWPATVRGGLRLGSGRLEIFNATGNGPGAVGELAGTVTWGAGASFTAAGRLTADLAALSPFLTGELPLAGKATGPVQIVYTSGVPIRVTMQAETTGLRIGRIVSDTARAELTLRPHRLDVERLDAQAYGGAFGGSVSLAFGQPMRLETDLSGKGADLSRLIALAGKTFPISSAADVTFAITGEPGRPVSWTGGGTFDAVPQPSGAAGRIPAGGRGRLTFASGHVRVDTDALLLAQSTVRLSLESDLSAASPPVDLAIDGSTSDARVTQLATMKFLLALEVPENRFTSEPLSGAGSFHAEVRTAMRSTTLDLALDLKDGSYAGEPFGSFALDLGLGASGVELRRVDLEGDGGSVSGHARFAVSTGAIDDIDLVARNVSIARILAKTAAGPSLGGRLDLDLRGSRDGSGFAAMGTAVARSVIVGHEIIDRIDAPVRFEGGRVILDGCVVSSQGLAGRVRVVYDVAKNEATVDVLSSRIDLAVNRTLADAGLTARGTVAAEGSVVVTRDGPAGVLRIVAGDLLLSTGRSGVREIRLGDLEGTGEMSSRGFEVSVRSMPQPAWTFEAFLGFERTLPISAVLYFDDLVVGAGGVFGESADLRLKGQVQAEGDLSEPRAMELNGAFDEVAVRLGPHVVRATEPFPLRLDSGRFLLGPSHLLGDGADISLSVNGSIKDGTVAGYLRGTLDLAIASSLWSEVRGAGPVDIDASLSGTLERPDLEGHVAVKKGRVRLIGYPQSLESIEAEARFEGQTLTLSSFHAMQGGGEIQANGQVDFDGVVPASYRATVTGANVSAKFPEGFKGTYDGRVSVTGTPKRATVSGRIDVVRGLYAQDFDLGLFGGAHRNFDTASESPIPRNVALDIDVLAAGNLWLRNDIARVEAAGQIHLGGELARPEVTGRFALVPGGTVRYRDVDYRIEYGTLDLTDSKRINPYLDVRGRTRVAEYEIALHVEGTLDKFDYELSSTPPLASQDIIALLVTGKTLDALSGPGTATALPGDMAAYYFAGLLSATFGKQIQNSLGIDQLEITPLLLKGASDPTARVTVGKQVGDSVKIVFSQDIGTAQKQTYQVSWDASHRVRLLAESDTRTGLGGELQYARQFGGTPIALRQAGVSDLSRTDGEFSVVSAVVVRSFDGETRADLVKRAGIRAGETFDRGRMLQGGDLIRAVLAKKGYLQASVRAESAQDDARPNATRVLYLVTAGPRVAVDIVVNGGRGRRSMRKAFGEFSKDTPYTPDFWEEATHALLDQLRDAGFYASDVIWRAVDGPGGRSVQILVDRGRPVRLRAIHFDGIESIPSERVEKLMTSLKAKALGKRLLRPAVLAADVASVRAFYREEGFTHVRIAEPRIALATTGDSAEVYVSIQEGPRFTVSGVAFSGDTTVSDEDMRSWLPLAPGDTFSPRRLAEAEQTLKDRLDVLGFPDASVESRVEFAGATAEVGFDVVGGDRSTVGQIAIEGNRVTRRRTIARALTFGRGDLVSRQSFLKSQQQLYRTGLFSSVKLTSERVPDDVGTDRRVTVKLEEAPPLAFGFGVGYDSSAGPRASVLLGYSNLGGRNVALTVQARVSQKENLEVLTVRRRSVFGNSIDSLGSVSFDKSKQDAFTQTRKSVSVRLEQRPKPRWIRFLRYGVQQVRISDITDSEAALEATFKDKLSGLRLAEVGLGLVRDTRDDAFLPTRGGYGSIEGSVFAKPLASQASFAKVFLRGSWTVSFKRGGSRFASFLRIGAAYPFSDTRLVPLSERFFAGGSSTLRGFATDSVGGLVVSGFNAGGEALLVLNEEWHFPIWRSLHGELFLDAGNVYPRIADFRPVELRSSAGAGLRLDTPIGPIRVEYGWKLDRREKESTGEVIFAIGAVF